MTNWIFRHKLQQRRVLKIIAAFKDDALMYQVRVCMQVNSQTFHVARVKKVHGTAKYRILNAFLERKTQIVRAYGFFDASLQPRPARKTSFSSDRELCVCQVKFGVEDDGVGRPAKVRVKLPDSLSC